MVEEIPPIQVEGPGWDLHPPLVSLEEEVPKEVP